MNILEIDAVNFAGRVAHVAAAELYGLLDKGEIAPDPAWFDRDAEAIPEWIGDKVETMAAYCMRRLCSGETLYRAHATGEWAEEALPRKLAFNLFASTIAGVGSKLIEEQRAAEAAAAMAARPAPAGLKLEDSIFEEQDSLGALRPEAVEAHKQLAAYEKARVQEERISRKLEAARRRKEKADAEVKTASDGVEAARQALESTLVDGKPPSAPKPMSIGEAPASRPVNRGGRGNRKHK